ncbi:MAG: hypothetical protein NVSMB47_12920 [Polyangiales bacterium]
MTRARAAQLPDVDAGPIRARVPLSTRIDTERLVLRAYRTDDVRAQRAFHLENAEHLAPWSPRPRPGESPGSLVDAARKIAAARNDWRLDRGYAFAVLGRGGRGGLVARVALNGIVRGSFQSAYLGYLVGASSEGRGLAREAVSAACTFAFGAARLHRVQAAIMPHNVRSLRLIAALGFREEGLAERYLRIDGEWRDHRIFACTAEEWAPPPSTHEVDAAGAE